MSLDGKPIPKSAVAITLYRTRGEGLIGCETVTFTQGYEGVHTVLRRAAISGRVEVGGDWENHFADLSDSDGSTVETVALDSKSYAALKNHWLRCRVNRGDEA